MRCNFCMNAGLPNTFHRMKSDWGIVICPVLKETVCNNCGEKGHTPKYCEKPLSIVYYAQSAPEFRLNPNAPAFYPCEGIASKSILMNPKYSPTLTDYQTRLPYMSAQEKEDFRQRIANDFEAFVRTTPFGQNRCK